MLHRPGAVNFIFEERSMKKFISLVLLSALVCGVLCAGGKGDGSSSSSALGDYPNKPIQIVVPFGPGGGTDVLVRTIMKYLDLGGQSTVAVNIDGASGFVGTMDAANRPNDGYSLLCAAIHDVLSYTMTGQTTRPLYQELVPICVIASDYDMVSTNKQSGFKTVQEMAAYAKAHPGEIRWGTTGTKTANAVNSMWMVDDLGLTGLVTFVPYDGGGTAKPALLGNHVQVLTGSSGDIRPLVASGEAVPLMVINDQRVRLMPNTPTTLESGCEATIFVARTLWAPKDTDPAKIKFLEAAFKKAAENPEFVKAVETLGVDVRFIDQSTTVKLVSDWRGVLEPRFARLQ
jgi:tripartite-type tricarboxylate transporter receptor subunit TctC